MLSIGDKPLLGVEHNDLVILYEPGLSSMNTGDRIISDSAMRYIEPILEWRNIAHVSTHQPTTFRYRRGLYHSAVGFVLGTNLLQNAGLFKQKNWKVTLVDTLQVQNLVLVGCGWKGYDNKKSGYYTKTLYRRLLSSEYLHSVRDAYTLHKLKELGINNVLNTGCPTLWKLTRSHCAGIRRRKGDIAVVTLTDYRRDPHADADMLRTLMGRYGSIYLWPQGLGDYAYLCELECAERVYTIKPTLQAYDQFLQEHPNADYVGTRLHGGIRALQHGNRSIIISVDNRAREMGKDFNLPVIERGNQHGLTKMIDDAFETRVTIDEHAIKTFLKQLASIAASIPHMQPRSAGR